MSKLDYIKENKTFPRPVRWTTFRNIVLLLASIFLLRCLYSIWFPKLTPVITIQDGKVQGKVAYSRDGKEYWQFLSIPFAEPPIGKLKFQPPVPTKPWTGIKLATGSIPKCIQFEAILAQVVSGQEDCLYLNVYAPPLTNEGDPKLPVLVHFYGGGFLQGASGLYGPDYLMDHPIIVVTFNYRLGPFGFLNFNHNPKIDGVHLPRGNMGLKDQLLALKWVQNNIAHFGGDPKRVAIGGESAGGVSVHLHVLSPKSRGLFHRAFAQSGSAFCSWGYTSKPREVALDYAKRMGCPLNNTKALLDCLENYDPGEMAKFQLSVTDPGIKKDNLSPSIEAVESEDRFLAEHPQDLMDSGYFSKVPFILGINSGDGGLRTARFEALPERVALLQNNWTETIGNVLLIDDLSPSRAEEIRDFYFKDNKLWDNAKLFKDNLTALFSDFFMFEPVHRAAIGHAKSDAETYLFYFNYTSAFISGSYSLFSAYSPNSWFNGYVQIAWNTVVDFVKEKILEVGTTRPYGIGHSEEIPQIWNYAGSKWISSGDTEFSKTLVKSIVQFAQGRSPVMFGNTVWPKIYTSHWNQSSKQYALRYMLMQNSTVGKVIPEPFAKSMQFWNSVKAKNFNRLVL